MGLSYDSPEILAEFGRRAGIEFPLLADPESKMLDRLGLVNTEADGLAKGVALPGILWVDREGKLKQKYFEDSYRDRLTGKTLLGRMFPELVMTSTPAVSAGQGLSYRLGQSGEQVIMGSIVDLMVEFTIPEKAHLYAEGEHSYRPLKLTLQENEWVQFGPQRLPQAENEHLPAIDETVPVYSGRVKLIQSLQVAPNKKAAQLEKPLTLTIKGTLEYQMCTESTCLLPVSKPVQWTLKLLPLDRVRSDEPIRHRQ